MKKKSLICILFASILICAVFVIVRTFVGTCPFSGLSVDKIDSVSVELNPPEVKKELDEKEIQSLVEILQDVTVCDEDNSYTEYYGQMCVFTITKKNGDVMKVSAYNPFIIIDATGYRCEYEVCEQLNNFANGICDTRFAGGEVFHFSAKVVEVNENQMLIEVTDKGNCAVQPGNQVYIPTGKILGVLAVGPENLTDNYIRIEFDGVVMESYPLQLGEVYRIDVVDGD